MKYMKTSCLWLFILCNCCTVFAQNQRLHFGVKFFPNYSWAKLVDDGSVPEGVVQSFRDLEIGRVSQSTQIFGEFAFSQRLAVSVGLGFQETGQATREQELIFPMPQPNDPEFSKFAFTYQYLELPVLLKVNFAHGFYLEAGSSMSFLLSNFRKSKLRYPNGDVVTERSPNDYLEQRRMMLNVQAGLGYTFFRQKNWQLFLQPTFQMALHGLAREVALNRHPFAGGLLVGVRY
ncbi:MAG: porin family protein [Bacteroidota bacterium]